MSNTGSDRLTNASTDANRDSHICAKCGQRFCINRGLTQHLRSCYLNNKITDVQTPYEKNEDKANNQLSDDSNIEIPDISTPSLRYKCYNYQDYLSLKKKWYTGRKIYFYYHLDKQERVS